MVKSRTVLVALQLREVKSEWEISMHRESGVINRKMFEAVEEAGSAGKTGVGDCICSGQC